MKMRRPGKTEPYILEADRGSESPTIFNIRELTWEEMIEVNDDPPMPLKDAMEVNAIMQLAKEEDRELTEAEVKTVNAISSSDQEMIFKANKQQAKIVSIGLDSIDNLFDENNEPMDMDAKSFVKFARMTEIREIGLAIMAMSQPGANAAKK